MKTFYDPPDEPDEPVEIPIDPDDYPYIPDTHPDGGNDDEDD